jgi:hypothetical protein
VNEDLRNRLLGGSAHDPGCEACFEILDQYAEALLRRDDVGRLYPEVVAHLAGCAACREDTEGLLAALRRDASPGPSR